MVNIFFLFSLVFIIGGLVSLTEITAGLGFVGIACYFGIWARIVQADKHYKIIYKLNELREIKKQ